MKRPAADEVSGRLQRRRKITQGSSVVHSPELSANELALRRTQRALERTPSERAVVLLVMKYVDESFFDSALSGY